MGRRGWNEIMNVSVVNTCMASAKKKELWFWYEKWERTFEQEEALRAIQSKPLTSMPWRSTFWKCNKSWLKVATRQMLYLLYHSDYLLRQTHAHHSSDYNIWDMEKAKMVINWPMSNKNVVTTHDAILSFVKKSEIISSAYKWTQLETIIMSEITRTWRQYLCFHLHRDMFILVLNL